MAARFVSVDRDTPMLLPPDLRDWVPEDDLVHFVIEAVDRLPLESFRVNHRGTGAKQFPPHMMLALLIYSYANGLFSSRKIERATHRDAGPLEIQPESLSLFHERSVALIEIQSIRSPIRTHVKIESTVVVYIHETWPGSPCIPF